MADTLVSIDTSSMKRICENEIRLKNASLDTHKCLQVTHSLNLKLSCGSNNAGIHESSCGFAGLSDKQKRHLIEALHSALNDLIDDNRAKARELGIKLINETKE